MRISVYNTLWRRKEEFVPLLEDHVGIYQCGPTVYWTQHIGNMRAAFVGDLINRTFLHAGYDVTFVRNYTDVGHLSNDNSGDADSGEDRMDIAAQRENLNPLQIAQKYIDIFEEDCKKLNILEPAVKPRATDNIPEIQEMISDLIRKDFAYITPLAVYFNVSKARDYTRLSGQKIEENKEGMGHGKVADPDKRNSKDFALWFFKAGEHEKSLQTWPSPFQSPLVKNGEGFPGWHIECSAMIKKYLGDKFDIHLGGIEHIPIHHTNEIAQSESANENFEVVSWMHYEHLLVNDKKMSKSEGTGYSLSEIEERFKEDGKVFNPLSLRYFYLQAHYRSKQNFTWDALQASQNGLEKMYSDLQSLGMKDELAQPDQDFLNKFDEKLGDDFNTPQALAVVHDVLRSPLPDNVKRATIYSFDDVLGLNLSENSESVEIKEEDLPTNVRDLLEQRKKAREEKDWQKSDDLRAQIEDAGYVVQDFDLEYIIKKK